MSKYTMLRDEKRTIEVGELTSVFRESGCAAWLMYVKVPYRDGCAIDVPESTLLWFLSDVNEAATVEVEVVWYGDKLALRINGEGEPRQRHRRCTGCGAVVTRGQPHESTCKRPGERWADPGEV